MHRERLAWNRIAAAGIDIACMLLVWLLVVGLRSTSAIWPDAAWLWGNAFGVGAHVSVGLLVLGVHSVVHWVRGDWGRGRGGSSRLAKSYTSAGVAAALVVSLLFLLDVEWVSRPVVVGYTVLVAPSLVLVRWIWGLLGPRLPYTGHRHRVLLVGESGHMPPLLQVLLAHPEWAVDIVGRVGGDPGGGVSWLGPVSGLGGLLVDQPIDEVIVVGPLPEMKALTRVAQRCDELGVALTLEANFLGLMRPCAEVRDLDGFGVVTFRATAANDMDLAVKRAIDIGGAALGLVLLAPFLILVSMAILVVEGGPVLFVQERAGLNGRVFHMYKFRTMVVGAEQQLDELLRDRNEAGGPHFKMSEDPRVTRLGRWLRRSSVDELPQLFNVLRGQMSLVGPRPPLPVEVAQYEPWQLRRLSMRPGLTCIWQVSGRSEIPFESWMMLDLEYIDKWSLWLDLSLLVRTVPAVLSGTGAR
ncbi:MAG: exopolysaccharide biosynthesis polyprenyl glycosylphosphotransferase [Kiritimatiellia bacterium]|jgi:exopolysaccharide biosynthesis polyprenyl glycosylphosphotransferase